MMTEAIRKAAMRAAIDEARTAIDEGEMPYGAVIMAADGSIVARAYDRIEGMADPTRHAEFDVVRLAVQARGPDLSGCIVASTVEPCCMCSGAAWYAGIATAVFGLTMQEALEQCPAAMEEALGPISEIYVGTQRKIKAVPGVLRDECLALWTLYSESRSRA